MLDYLNTVLERLIENPKPGAVTTGVSTVGGYTIAESSTAANTLFANLDLIQIIGVASMIFGMIVGCITLWAAIVRMRADKSKRKYYEQKCKGVSDKSE